MNHLLKKLFEADQKDRKHIIPSSNSIRKLIRGDKNRRSKVFSLLLKGEIREPQDFYRAAMILQHGDQHHHYRLANILARESMEAGYKPARWLYAATLDRYLMSIGRPQKFGTQFVKNTKSDKWKLYKYDKKTSDAERARYNVPAIKNSNKQ